MPVFVNSKLGEQPQNNQFFIGVWK